MTVNELSGEVYEFNRTVILPMPTPGGVVEVQRVVTTVVTGSEQIAAYGMTEVGRVFRSKVADDMAMLVLLAFVFRLVALLILQVRPTLRPTFTPSPISV